MDLRDYVNIKANQLSGGNKRKLSVSMAMLGNPPLIFLDEPSTGVDPQAKRFMWNIVSKISREKKQSTVILTTHSMEEADVLVSTIRAALTEVSYTISLSLLPWCFGR